VPHLQDAKQVLQSARWKAESGAILGFENDHKDQIHYETARQSRSALGIGLIIR
jgi:hypothetical protein